MVDNNSKCVGDYLSLSFHAIQDGTDSSNHGIGTLHETTDLRAVALQCTKTSTYLSRTTRQRNNLN